MARYMSDAALAEEARYRTGRHNGKTGCGKVARWCVGARKTT